MFKFKIFFVKRMHFATRATLMMFCLLVSVRENMNTIMSAPSILIIVSSKYNFKTRKFARIKQYDRKSTCYS